MRKPRPPSPFATSHATLWPFADYPLWIEALRRSIGETIYLAEIHLSEIHASAELSSQGYELLALLDFPRPDPQRRLYPHLILLDDGRGINLGRIARISRHTPYRPASEDLLYLEQQLCDEQLYRPQRLTPQRIAATSRQLLGTMLTQRPNCIPSAKSERPHSFHYRPQRAKPTSDRCTAPLATHPLRISANSSAQPLITGCTHHRIL